MYYKLHKQQNKKRAAKRKQIKEFKQRIYAELDGAIKSNKVPTTLTEDQRSVLRKHYTKKESKIFDIKGMGPTNNYDLDAFNKAWTKFLDKANTWALENNLSNPIYSFHRKYSYYGGIGNLNFMISGETMMSDHQLIDCYIADYNAKEQKRIAAEKAKLKRQEEAKKRRAQKRAETKKTSKTSCDNKVVIFNGKKYQLKLVG